MGVRINSSFFKYGKLWLNLFTCMYIDTDNTTADARVKGGGGLGKGKGGQYTVTEDLALDGEHTMQYTVSMLQMCAFETYIILLTNATPVNLMK